MYVQSGPNCSLKIWQSFVQLYLSFEVSIPIAKIAFAHISTGTAFRSPNDVFTTRSLPLAISRITPLQAVELFIQPGNGSL